MGRKEGVHEMSKNIKGGTTLITVPKFECCWLGEERTKIGKRGEVTLEEGGKVIQEFITSSCIK